MSSEIANRRFFDENVNVATNVGKKKIGSSYPQPSCGILVDKSREFDLHKFSGSLGMCGYLTDLIKNEEVLQSLWEADLSR